MHRSPTSLASWVSVIHRTLVSCGCDADGILLQAGISPASLRTPQARIPIEQTSLLWRLATAASGDAGFGIRVASHVRANTFHALGLSLAASPTLRDAFARLLRYFRIVSDAGELHFTVDGEWARFELMAPDGYGISHESVDAFMSCMVRMCRALASPMPAEPVEVQLKRPCPQDTQAFDAAFRCPIHYGSDRNELRFRLSELDAPLRDGDAHLARHHDPILVKMLADVEKDNLQHRVLGLLVELLPRGGATQERVAERLGLSLRTLQRRLQEQGTSYCDILDRARLAVARRLLSQEVHALSEIAYLLGFSDLSGFSRFFKRATGEAPGAHRHRLLGADEQIPSKVQLKFDQKLSTSSAGLEVNTGPQHKN